jgi:hypothetical protein
MLAVTLTAPQVPNIEVMNLGSTQTWSPETIML